jgi:flagellar motor switch protein FliM
MGDGEVGEASRGNETLAGSKSIMPWDIRQAGKIRREPLRALTLLHETFARKLSHSLGTFLCVEFGTTLASLDELGSHEFSDCLPDVTYLCSLKLTPLDTRAFLQLDLSVAFPLIDLLLGGDGKGAVEPREVTEIEEQILQTIIQMVCRELAIAWEPLGLEFNITGRHAKANVSRVIPPQSKMLVLRFDVTMLESRGNFHLAIPTTVSTALLRKISVDRPSDSSHGASESLEQVKSRLRMFPFPVELVVPNIRVPAEELIDVNAGDMILLPQSIGAPAKLLVGGHPLFEATVMRYERRRVARLGGRLPTANSAGKEMQ